MISWSIITNNRCGYWAMSVVVTYVVNRKTTLRLFETMLWHTYFIIAYGYNYNKHQTVGE
ncbi:hypothetical protein KSZ_44220 [Dictyobacter formicarum]|uniref:Uncharacterized protein n=1 Tax=Dictyobacter formicarum TaxID=2778368 RepID=A0ABQ3VMU6_9CHLR|nr:hypothetical protein KSZ_44220 [Dictyobacter formicarum]